MYEELIKRLKDYSTDRKGEIAELTEEAADAIEELEKKMLNWQATADDHWDAYQLWFHKYMDDMPTWIPVTERLPEATGHKMYWVIVRSKYPENKEMFGQVAEYEARFGHPFWDVAQSEYVTHWMPLPEPPKEETE